MRTHNSTDRALVAVAGLAGIAALLPADGYAAVEFVTPVGSCSKVDRIGDGSDLKPLEQGRQPQIRAGNVARPDDPDTKICHLSFPQKPLAEAIDRVANRASSFGLSCSMTKCLTPILRSAAMIVFQSTVP